MRFSKASVDNECVYVGERVRILRNQTRIPGETLGNIKPAVKLPSEVVLGFAGDAGGEIFGVIARAIANLKCACVVPPGAGVIRYAKHHCIVVVRRLDTTFA